MAGIYPLGRQVDHAVAAFIEDVRERGLADKILLVVTGEMGRTPQLNKNGGRDHYGELTPLLFAGGGLKMGQVIGQSDPHATQPATHALQPHAPPRHDLPLPLRHRPAPPRKPTSPAKSSASPKTPSPSTASFPSVGVPPASIKQVTGTLIFANPH